MSGYGKSNPTVVRTARGLTVGGTRLAIYSLIDHFKAGDSDESVMEWYRLNPQQLADIHQYIDEHSEEVEAEYQEVLQHAEESRRYWEERNRAKLEEIERLPKTPRQQAIRAKIAELKQQLDRS
jgi:uncharacterized protein (DUF433 family)